MALITDGDFSDCRWSGPASPRRGAAIPLQFHRPECRLDIGHTFSRRGAFLYQESDLVMPEDLRDPRFYFSILRAIDDGHTTTGAIEQRVRGPIGGGHLTSYLETLLSLGFVERRTSVPGGPRRSIWRVADSYLRFWFRFVLPNRATLDRSPDPMSVYDALVATQFDAFVGRYTFEDICRGWVRDRSAGGDLPAVDEVGAWWGPVPAPRADNPRYQTEGELEVVAVRENKVVLAGEAKWTNAAVDLDVLVRLRSLVPRIPGAGSNTRPVVFGRHFTDRLRARATSEGVRLVSLAELYG